jgi:hypothetical protein
VPALSRARKQAVSSVFTESLTVLRESQDEMVANGADRSSDRVVAGAGCWSGTPAVNKAEMLQRMDIRMNNEISHRGFARRIGTAAHVVERIKSHRSSHNIPADFPHFAKGVRSEADVFEKPSA